MTADSSFFFGVVGKGMEGGEGESFIFGFNNGSFMKPMFQSRNISGGCPEEKTPRKHPVRSFLFRLFERSSSVLAWFMLNLMNCSSRVSVVQSRGRTSHPFLIVSDRLSEEGDEGIFSARGFPP